MDRHPLLSSGRPRENRLHSAIGYLRPADLHAGTHTVIVEHRQAALDAAYAAHAERFTARPTRAKIPTKAWINRPSIQASPATSIDGMKERSAALA